MLACNKRKRLDPHLPQGAPLGTWIQVVQEYGTVLGYIGYNADGTAKKKIKFLSQVQYHIK